MTWTARLQRWLRHHQLHGHLQSGGAASDLHLRPPPDGERADQRHHLHLHGDRPTPWVPERLGPSQLGRHSRARRGRPPRSPTASRLGHRLVDCPASNGGRPSPATRSPPQGRRGSDLYPDLQRVGHHQTAGLTNGTSYTFTVTATNGSVPVPPRPSRPGDPVHPGRPDRVTATYANTQSMVSWTAPASNGGAAITSYTVTASGWPRVPRPSTPRPPPHGDRSDQRHRVHLHGDRHQPVGTGRLVGLVGRRHPATVPGAPTGVTATSYANASVWCPGRRRPPTVGAHHRLHGDLMPAWRPTCNIGGPHRDGHRPDQRRRLHLHRDRHQHRGPGPLRPLRPRPFRPPRRRTHTATPPPSQSVVSWTAPASNDGATITSYTVTSSSRRGQTCTRPPRDDHHLDGDRADQRHRLHLHGDRHQLAGTSAASAPRTRTTPATPGAPTVGPPPRQHPAR